MKKGKGDKNSFNIVIRFFFAFVHLYVVTNNKNAGKNKNVFLFKKMSAYDCRQYVWVF